TESSTHTASASARCDTQAPFSMNRSAAEVCFGSSRVISLTRMFVSIARITLLHARANTFLELVEPPFWRTALPKDSLVNFRGRELTRSTHNNLISLFLP